MDTTPRLDNLRRLTFPNAPRPPAHAPPLRQDDGIWSEDDMDDNDNCIRCGLPESHQKHDSKHPPPEGWHPYRGQDYLDGLEDALLFVRENKQPHQWERNGITVDTAEPFDEKYCAVCGAINWGGAEDGICFGNHYAELGRLEAHNRRAHKLTLERLGIVPRK